MIEFKDIREKFNQRVPSGKRLTDMEMFLDAKDIEKALKILATQLKKAKITFNKKMKNIKRSDMGTGDVAINAIDEGDRWRLIVMKNAPDMKNRKEIDLTSAFMAIQKLPSAQFKNMYAEGKEEKQSEVKYMTWNNKDALANEGTMSSGIFDKDKDKAKDAARNFVKFLRKNRNVTVEPDPDNPKKDHPDLEKYTDELTSYVFDDEMLDMLDPSNRRNAGKNANDIVKARLKKLGVNIR